MLATIGDLVQDVVVRLGGPINIASDTPAQVTRRRGGSAANVAETAARLGHAVRFIGQVGDDPLGDLLVDELAGAAVDTTAIRRAGTTGTIVVLVDGEGERSMLTDRRTCVDLTEPEPSWLDGVTTLHVPLYSLIASPIAATTTTLIGWAHRRGVAVSIDPSSVALIRAMGVAATKELLSTLEPTVVLPNEAEAEILGIDSSFGTAMAIVKRGDRPAVVYQRDRAAVEVPAMAIGDVADSTGAGDAFAAGFLSYEERRPGGSPAWTVDPIAACEAGHRAAAGLLTSR